MTHAGEQPQRGRSTGTTALATLFLGTVLVSTGMLVLPAAARLVVAQAQRQGETGTPAGAETRASGPPPEERYEYDPAQRRDPFNPLISGGDTTRTPREDLPPLQRVGVTEINLIGIIWGGFGYTAMVQTPDGKGYAVRRGTRIGPNNGIVSKISENSITVTERFTDLYGKEQEREYVKLLHSSEDVE